MKTKILIIIIAVIGLGVGGFFVWKNIFVPEGEEKITEIEEKETTSTSTPVSEFTKITDMSWDSKEQIIEITLDPFPSTWGNWKMYVDGKEMSMQSGSGNPAVRPNAPLDKHPTGLIVGTLPWAGPLTKANFPCCGTMQFYVPNEGLTNEYKFNWSDFDCETASKKECPSEWVRHHGDLIVEGTETKVIEDVKYFQEGNIYVNDQAKLIIRNSELMMGRGDVPTIHVYIFVSPNASLEIENSSIFPRSGLVCVMNQGKTNITDSPTSIHYFDMSQGAQLTMKNSEMIFEIGGLLQVAGGDITLIDSTIGALALSVPANAHMDIGGLKSGECFESWDVQDLIPEIGYSLVMENSCILKDDFMGELKHGPYERGWLFFLDSDAHVKISDSELRKVFIDLINEKDVRFENLKIGIPSSLKYRDIELKDITMMGQWPFHIIDSNVTIKNSDYLFLQPSGQSTITLIDSHMCEFIPRDFFGTMIFENGLWTIAGEIIGGVPYHSMENDFTIKGSLRIDEKVRISLQWKDAQVTREYDVIVNDENGNPIQGALIKINDETITTDTAGKAKFSLILNEFNYNKPHILEIYQEDELIAQEEIDFFTNTPIVIGRE